MGSGTRVQMGHGVKGQKGYGASECMGSVGMDMERRQVKTEKMWSIVKNSGKREKGLKTKEKM